MEWLDCYQILFRQLCIDWMFLLLLSIDLRWNEMAGGELKSITRLRNLMLRWASILINYFVY